MAMRAGTFLSEGFAIFPELTSRRLLHGQVDYCQLL
jgi:hypothetical protein